MKKNSVLVSKDKMNSELLKNKAAAQSRSKQNLRQKFDDFFSSEVNYCDTLGLLVNFVMKECEKILSPHQLNFIFSKYLTLMYAKSNK